MSLNPLVSIQIPTYNQKQYIKDALDSALAQNYDNLQVIVSDDCSPDYDIFEYLKDYLNNPKVLIHRNEKNLGRVANYRNTLYNLVKGEWFVNLDGDDYFINDDFIAVAIGSIRKSALNGVAFFQGDANIAVSKSYEISVMQVDENTVAIENLNYLKYIDKGMGFMHANFLFNTQIAKDANFYSHDILDADYFSFVKILKNGWGIFSEIPVYQWRIHDEQATYTVNFDQVLKKYRALSELKELYRTINSAQHMLKVTERNLYMQLVAQFRYVPFTIANFKSVLSKTKLQTDYIIPFISSCIKNLFL